MPRSNILLKTFNLFFPIIDFLYILQLEEYYNLLYVEQLPRRFWRRNFQNRGKLKWTNRTKVTFVLASLLAISVPVVALSIVGVTNLLQLLLLLPFQLVLVLLLTPLWVLAANLFLTPIYNFGKALRQRRAAAIIAKDFHHVKVITVAGSYGKTTVKNFLHQLLRHRYRTQMTPGTINTPIGIAKWIINDLKSQTEVIILEADADMAGKLKEVAAIAPSDIAVITTIGDQHLSRLGTMANLARATIELLWFAKHYAKLVTSTEVVGLLNKFELAAVFPGENKQILEIQGSSGLMYMGTELVAPSQLSEFNLLNLALALRVAEELDVPLRFIEDEIKRLELPDRRKNITDMYGFETIDDSYNLSYSTGISGVRAARELADKKSKKLLVITAGIPDLGKENADANVRYGEFLAENADEIVVLNSILAKDIEKGIWGKEVKSKGKEGSKSEIRNPKGMWPAWDYIQENFDPEEYLVLMQPELNDLYY